MKNITIIFLITACAYTVDIQCQIDSLDNHAERTYYELTPLELLEKVETLEHPIGYDHELFPSNWVNESNLDTLLKLIASTVKVVGVFSLYESLYYPENDYTTKGKVVRQILTGYLTGRYFGPYQEPLSEKEIIEKLHSTKDK
jgi:hypothetical protein